MPSGYIIIDKPDGWTSHDVVAKCRGIFGEKRVGHTGTLDPMATGVLPIFVGRGTRAIPLINDGDKTYLASCQFGLTSDTQDRLGEILSRREVSLTQAQLEAALEQFRGTTTQIPPMYSALKVNGQKLYDLARRGIEVERKAREITIHKLSLLDFDGTSAQLLVTCSKGTYIRTLCHDLGELLGCGALMSALQRSEACGFTLDEAVSMQALQEQGAALLRPLDTLFPEAQKINLTQNQAKCARNGGAFSTPLSDGDYRAYFQGEFLMLGNVKNGIMSTVKSFYEVQP